MSLDVYLYYEAEPTEYDKAIALLREHGLERAATTLEVHNPEQHEEAYSANITHNLNKMAGEAGIYEHLWRPDEIGITKAKELIEPLAKALDLMRSDPARFEAFNSPNGWGLYKHFVPWVSRYLDACRDHPEALVRVSR